MDIDEILQERRKGLMYNVLLKHEQRLRLKRDLDGIYDLAGDVINFPDRYKTLINKIKKYEEQG